MSIEQLKARLSKVEWKVYGDKGECLFSGNCPSKAWNVTIMSHKKGKVVVVRPNLSVEEASGHKPIKRKSRKNYPLVEVHSGPLLPTPPFLRGHLIFDRKAFKSVGDGGLGLVLQEVKANAHAIYTVVIESPPNQKTLSEGEVAA